MPHGTSPRSYSHRVVVVGTLGDAGIETAVQAFLTTTEGNLLSGGPRGRDEEGPVMARLRRLRATMQ